MLSNSALKKQKYEELLKNLWRHFCSHKFIQEVWPNRPSMLDDVETLIFSIIFHRMGRCISRPSSSPRCPALQPEVASRGCSTSPAWDHCPAPSPGPGGSTDSPWALFIYSWNRKEKKWKEILEDQVYSHQLLALQATQGILVCLHPHLDPSGFKWTIKRVSQGEAETKLKTSCRSKLKVAKITYRWTRRALWASLPLPRYEKKGISQNYSNLLWSFLKITDLQIIRNNPELPVIVESKY